MASNDPKLMAIAKKEGVITAKGISRDLFDRNWSHHVSIATARRIIGTLDHISIGPKDIIKGKSYGKNSTKKIGAIPLGEYFYYVKKYYDRHIDSFNNYTERIATLYGLKQCNNSRLIIGNIIKRDIIFKEFTIINKLKHCINQPNKHTTNLMEYNIKAHNPSHSELLNTYIRKSID